MDYLKCQCGYTRLGGQEAGSGWQAISLDGEMSPDLDMEYSALQGQNVANQALVDKDGNAINVFEIIGHNNKVFLSRIQYGLSDDVGRHNNMFVHTFVFDGADNRIYDNPNSFLTVKDECFITSIAQKNNVKHLPDLYDRYDKISAMRICGFNEDVYRLLILATFEAIKQKKALYIILNDYSAQIRPCLYLIYSAIPLSIRKTLSVSTKLANPANERTIVFSDDYKMTDFFFDLTTGNNNVITEKINRRYQKYGFADYCISKTEEESLNYFKQLEHVAIKLGDLSASKISAFRVAHSIISLSDNEQYSEDELVDRIYTALISGFNSKLMDSYLEHLLKKLNDSHFLLPSETEDVLASYLAQCDNDELINQGRISICNGILELPDEESLDRVLQKSIEYFDIYSKYFEHSEKGNSLIRSYLENRINETNDYNELAILFNDHCKELSLNIFADLFINDGINKYSQIINSAENLEGEFSKWADFLSKLSPDGDREIIEHQLKIKYWENFDFADFDLSKRDEYFFMGDSKIDKFKVISTVFSIHDKVVKDDFAGFLADLHALVDIHNNQLDYNQRLIVWDTFFQNEAAMGSAPSEAEYYELAFKALDPDAHLRIKDMVNCFGKNDSHSFQRKYNEYADVLIRISDEKQLLMLLNVCLLEFDDTLYERMIQSLDFWLIISDRLESNPFDFLDEVDGVGEMLSEMDEEIILNNNKLIYEPYYTMKAEEYINSEDSTYKHMMKKWIKQIRKEKKKEEKGNKKSIFRFR